MAPHFRERVDIWLPLGMTGSFYGGAAVYANRIARVFQLIGRTGVGATDEEIGLFRTTSSLRSWRLVRWRLPARGTPNWSDS